MEDGEEVLNLFLKTAPFRSIEGLNVAQRGHSIVTARCLFGNIFRDEKSLNNLYPRP